MNAHPTPRALVVDDDPMSGWLVVQLLGDLGLAADDVAGAEEALAALRSGAYDLMVCDIQMPGKDGYQLAAEVRAGEAHAAAARIPILALTAGTEPTERERCRTAGMDEMLQKGCHPVELAAVVHRLVPALASAPSIDNEVLDALAGGDRALAAEILADYLASAHEDLGALRREFDAGRQDEVRRAAHKMKGAAGLVGARAVAEAAAALEHAATATLAGAPVALLDDLVGRIVELGEPAGGAPTPRSPS